MTTRVKSKADRNTTGPYDVRTVQDDFRNWHYELVEIPDEIVRATSGNKAMLEQMKRMMNTAYQRGRKDERALEQDLKYGKTIVFDDDSSHHRFVGSRPRETPVDAREEDDIHPSRD